MADVLSSHRRLILLVVVLAAAAAGVGFFTLSRSADSSAAPRAAAAPSHAASAPAKKTPEVAKKAPAAKPRLVAANGLPIVIANALRRHRVVVVALYASDVPLDRLARTEARSGARDAGAGYVAVNALDRKRSEPLATTTGVVDAPTTLVFRRPGTLVGRIAGFADRVTVAQAAANAGA
jgi:hypothetical protein